jgi:hypothetical protein
MKYSKLLFLSMSLFLILASLVWQAGVTPPAQAGPGLPPRETPTPARSGDDDDDDAGSASPVGAYISLQAGGVPAGAWSVVQWQDSAGNWHEVEGWRGSAANSSRWWVHPKDFGTGPFRWLVTTEPGGTVLKVSEPLSLPSGANETTLVTVEQ